MGDPKSRTQVGAGGVSIPSIPDIGRADLEKLIKLDKYNIAKRAASGKPLTREQRGILEAALDGESETTTVSFVSTKRQAAKLLGCSRPTLDDWIAKMQAKDQDPIRANGEIDLIGIRRFRRTNGAGEPTEITEDEKAELQRLRSQLLLVKLETERLNLENLRGTLLDMDTMVKQTNEAFGALRYMLLSRWDALSVTLAGQTVPEIKRRGRTSDTEILMQFSGGDWPPHIKETVDKFLLWLEAEKK